MIKFNDFISFSLGISLCSAGFAASYTLPPANESIIGNVQYVAANSGDNVVNIAQRFNLGFNALLSANPELDMARSFASGTQIVIPTEHILPSPRQGIVVNLPEMRMYYYPKGTNTVLTYPIGIGKIGRTIPITNTAIIRKAKDPVWVPPPSIREFNLEQGIVLPKVMPPGPDNPLGQYAIYMRLPTYLIHSTIFPESVGKRASFGCIRMYESDIEDFFPSIVQGIPVAIINQPVKLGWEQRSLMIEAHEPLEEHAQGPGSTLSSMVQMVASKINHQPTLVDWQMINYLSTHRDGIPHEVGVQL